MRLRGHLFSQREQERTCSGWVSSCSPRAADAINQLLLHLHLSLLFKECQPTNQQMESWTPLFWPGYRALLAWWEEP